MTDSQNERRGAGHGVVQRLLASLDDLGPTGRRLLVAFSGGADSTALAVGAAEARRARRLRPWLAHVAHGVRPEAVGDPLVALRTAEHLHLPLSIRVVPAGAIAAHAGCGPEEAMRRERYLLLARMTEATGSAGILTAHHADDQAETVLAHLIRGAGLDGAAGMRPRTTLAVPWWPSQTSRQTLHVIRPLLGERRASLRELAEAMCLDIVADATNDDVERTRAALRHDVLPVLERINPGATAALARFAEVAADHLDRPGGIEDDVGVGRDRRLQVEVVTALGVHEQRSAIRGWVRRETGAILTFERTEALRRWIADAGGGRIEIGEGRLVVRSKGALSIRTRTG